MFGIITLQNVIIAAVISGLLSGYDRFVLGPRRRESGEEPPTWARYANSGFGWLSVIALFWLVLRQQGLELALVVGTVLTGAIYALELAVLRKRRHERLGEGAPEPAAVEYARSFFPVIVIVLLVRSFLFEPFRIPSSSMVPTLLVGDFIFVNKFTYGLRLPVLKSEIVSFGAPKRGDVVVFRLPADERTNYIKRVVGLPGDRVSYRAGQLRINDEVVDLKRDSRYTGPGAEEVPWPLILYKEQLGESEHDLLRVADPRRQGREGDWRVPEGQYFMMGDNRDNSKDSRYREVGLIPAENLVGRAERVWLSISFRPTLGLRLNRFGKSIG
jgi:signal peptidase I